MKILALILALSFGMVSPTLAGCGSSDCYKPDTTEGVQP